MSATRSCRILILFGLVALPRPLQAQNWKDELKQSILTFIKLTTFSSDAVRIADQGSLLVVAKDGIAAGLSSSLTVPTSHVRGGIIHKSGGLLSALISSSTSRDFRLDEQVYIGRVNVKDEAIELFLFSSETEAIEVQGSRQQTRYRGVLSFDFPREYLPTADFASVRDTIVAVLRVAGGTGVAAKVAAPGAPPPGEQPAPPAPIVSDRPPIPFEDSGSCSGESCSAVGKVRADKEITIHRDRNKSSPIVFKLREGEQVTALTSVLITTELGRATVLKPTLIGGVQANPGDIVFLLSDKGEGHWKAWYKGKLIDDVQRLDTEAKDFAEAKSISWVLIRNSTGQLGWSDEPNDFCLPPGVERECALSYERRTKLWHAPPTGVAIPKFANTNEKDYLAAMKSDLRNMATYEEQYAADNRGAYFSGTATSAAALQGYTPSQNVTVVVTAVAGPRPSWSATATHTQTAKACAMTGDIAITCAGEPSTQRTLPDIPAAVPQPPNQAPSELDAALSGTYFPVNPLPAGFGEDFAYLILSIKGPKIDGKVGQRRGIGVADRQLPMKKVRLNGKQFSFEIIQQDGVRFVFAGEFVGPTYSTRLRGHLKRLSSGGVQQADVELYPLRSAH
jgi:hypothetical protein